MRPVMFTNTETSEMATYGGEGFNTKVQRLIDDSRDDSLEDAFFVCDIGDILRKHQRWQELLPRVRPHYAVKCNDDTVVLETMASIGLGFDCASKSEIKKVLDCGVDADRIVYANPCKQSSHIKYACNRGVDVMTFDNLDELDKIKRLFPTARLVLRILPAEFKATCNLGIKFGAPQSQVPALLARAQQLQLNVIGVSFHVGSGCLEAAAFPSAVQLARETFDECLGYGFEPYLLDIGGGFPGDEMAAVSFEEICAVLAPSLDEHFPACSGVDIIAEPGRYFVGSAYSLVVNVIAKRRVAKDNVLIDDTTIDADAEFMYYVNDGVYGSFNCLLYDHAQVHPVVPGMSPDEPEYACSIWGPTCDGLDCISTKTYLPLLEVGDWIVFNNMGAYTMSAGSTFNGMPRPKGHYVIGMDELAALDRESCHFLHKLVASTTPPLLIDHVGPQYSDYLIAM